MQIAITLHAVERATQRQVPDEILAALQSAPRYKVYADFGGEATAAIVRGTTQYWIQILCVNVALTVYPVTEARMGDWGWRRLRNRELLPQILSLPRVLTKNEEVTAELSDLWIQS